MINRTFLRTSLAAATLLLAAATTGAQPQDNPDPLAHIRQTYTRLKQHAHKAENNKTEIHTLYEIADGQLKDETIQYFFDRFAYGTGNDNGYAPYLITKRHTIAERKRYEEYLYQTGTGFLIFALIQEQDNNGMVNETRYYWSDNVLINEIITGQRLLLPEQVAQQSEQLIDAFDKLYN